MSAQQQISKEKIGGNEAADKQKLVVLHFPLTFAPDSAVRLEADGLLDLKTVTNFPVPTKSTLNEFGFRCSCWHVFSFYAKLMFYLYRHCWNKTREDHAHYTTPSFPTRSTAADVHFDLLTRFQCDSITNSSGDTSQLSLVFVMLVSLSCHITDSCLFSTEFVMIFYQLHTHSVGCTMIMAAVVSGMKRNQTQGRTLTGKVLEWGHEDQHNVD